MLHASSVIVASPPTAALPEGSAAEVVEVALEACRASSRDRSVRMLAS